MGKEGTNERTNDVQWGECLYRKKVFRDREKGQSKHRYILLGYCSHQVSLALVLFHVCKLRTAKFNLQAIRLQ